MRIWIRNLRIILRAEKKEEILDTPLAEAHEDNASTAEKNAYKKACDADLEVSCLMLACMQPELQMQFKNNHAAYDISIALMICSRPRLELKGSKSQKLF